jgi:hypothetical protein
MVFATGYLQSFTFVKVQRGLELDLAYPVGTEAELARVVVSYEGGGPALREGADDGFVVTDCLVVWWSEWADSPG